MRQWHRLDDDLGGKLVAWGREGGCEVGQINVGHSKCSILCTGRQADGQLGGAPVPCEVLHETGTVQSVGTDWSVVPSHLRSQAASWRVFEASTRYLSDLKDLFRLSRAR